MRTIFCRKLQQELPGLERAPFPGPRGEDIYQHISAEAWQQWLQHQTRLVNEKRLNMMEASSRSYLQEQMQRFFSGEQVDQAEGFVPPQ